MSEALKAKFGHGRPVDFTEAEAAAFVEAIREAVATVLERPVADVTDEALLFDELGLDSVDVFDLLDQLAERFEVQVEIETLPERLLRGDEQATFRGFAAGLVAYFRSAPEAEPSAG